MWFGSRMRAYSGMTPPGLRNLLNYDGKSDYHDAPPSSRPHSPPPLARRAYARQPPSSLAQGMVLLVVLLGEEVTCGVTGFSSGTSCQQCISLHLDGLGSGIWSGLSTTPEGNMKYLIIRHVISSPMWVELWHCEWRIDIGRLV